MAVKNIRQYGVRTVPLLLDRISFSDIVNDVTVGGTNVPCSAESVKGLNAKVDQEIADRVQAIVDLIGGATTTGNTLGKLEASISDIANNGSVALDQEIADRIADVDAEEARALASEAALNNTIAQEVTDRTNAVSALETSLTTALTAETDRAKAAEAANTAAVTTLNGDETVAGSVDQKIKIETDRAIAEEARIESTLTDAITTATTDMATQTFVNDQINIESTRAQNAEAANATAIAQEVTDRTNEIARVDTSITNLTSTVDANKIAATDALTAEATTRSDADSALSDRLNAVEGSLVAGVSWKGSVDVLSNPDTGETALDDLVEADLVAGQAYYVITEKDVYVVLNDVNGDYMPAGFTTISFLKIADFAELSGLVTAEKNRALAEEAALNARVDALSTSTTADTDALNAKIDTEIDRAQTAETTLDGKIAQAYIDFAAADDAVRSEFAAADTTLDNRITTEVSTLNTTITNNQTAIETALTTETDRAKAAEATNAAAITTLNGDATVVGSVDQKVKVETDRALAAEQALSDAIAQEAADRATAVSNEAARAEAAETALDDKITQEIADRIADVDAEEARALAAEATINSTLDIIVGDKTVVGSVANAQYEAQVYADHWIPMMKMEGADGTLAVSGDTVTLVYNPMTDGIIYNEVIVYDPTTGDAIAVNVKSVAANVLTLDTTTTDEFDGYSCKVQYMLREGDQDGAGMGVAGEGGAGD